MKKNITQILEYLNEILPNAHCELEYSSPYQLLVAVILSAQCTDKRVNLVTKELFKVAPTPKKMLELGEEKLKEIIKSCGFYNQKAKSIVSATRDIINKHSGNIPNNMKDLTALKGVGRKTANVVLGEYFKTPAIAVDTHVLRLSKRLGLTKPISNPDQCENDLNKLITDDRKILFHHQMIWFGRYYCTAKKPSCENCGLQDICKYYKKKK